MADNTIQNGLTQAALDRELAAIDLKGLGDWAWNEYLNNVPQDQIWLDMQSQEAYKNRFPGIAAARQRGDAITEAQYINLEQAYQSANQAAGLPSGFYDTREDFGNAIAKNVSPTEWSNRLNLWTQYTYNSDPTLRAELSRLNPDITPGDMVSYVMDPTRAEPLLQQQFTQAQIGAASLRSGYGLLTKDEAAQLAKLGITSDQASQGFSSLVQNADIFKGQLGQSDQNTEITRQQQLNMQFGNDAGVAKLVSGRQKQNIADFNGGGAVAQDRQGIAAFASASTK